MLHSDAANYGGGQKKGFARNLMFGASCVPKPPPLKDSLITTVLQVV